MKTLILNASPRKTGDSAHMTNLLVENLAGEVEIIHLFKEKIAPCIDCRNCREEMGCALGEDFAPLAERIQTADAIVIASPIWFGTLPGPFLSAMSRLQIYFSGRIFRKEGAAFWGKKGAVLLAGGGSGGEESAFRTAEILLREMGVEGEIFRIFAAETDMISAKDDMDLTKEIKNLAKSLR